MKKVLLVLALVAVSGLSADMRQSLQGTKEGIQKVGAKVADRFNIPKYFRLLKVAKADLQDCAIEQCPVLYKKVVSIKSPALEREYQACLKARCPAQYKQYLEKRNDYVQRVGAVIAGASVATAVTGAAIGARVIKDRMNREEEPSYSYRSFEQEFYTRHPEQRPTSATEEPIIYKPIPKEEQYRRPEFMEAKISETE